MIQQFEINKHVQKQLREFLDARQTDLQAAMQDETLNGEIAALLHAGFPMMVRKIYSLPKFQSFFWDKRQLLAVHIQNRLDAAAKSKKR